MVRRVLGTDQGGIARNSIRRAGQVVQETNQILTQGNQRQAEISAQLTNDAMKRNDAVASSIVAQSQSNIQRLQGSQANLNQFIKGVTDIGNVINKSREIDAQRDLQRQAQQAEVENLQAFVEMKQLTANAQERIYSTSPDEYEAQIHKTLGKYKNLSPQDQVKLFGYGYEALSSVEKERFTKIRDDIDKINSQVASQKKQEISLITSGVLSRLESSFGSAQPFIDEYDKSLKQFFSNPANKDLSPLQIAQIQTFALEELAQSTRLNSNQRAEIERKSIGAKQFLTEASRAYEEFGNNPELYQTRLYQIANETGFPYDVALKVTDPNQSSRQLLEHTRIQNELRDLQSANLMRDFNNQRFNDKYVGMTALLLLNDPQFEASVEANPTTKDNVLIKTAMKIKEQVQNYEKLNQAVGRDVQSLQNQLAAWNTTTTKYITSNGESQNPQDLLAQFMTLNQSNIPGMLDRIAELEGSMPTVDPSNPSFTPQQRQEALRQWAEWRARGAKAIQNQINLRQRELSTEADKLERYGILGIDANDPATLERLRGEYDSMVGEIKAITQQAPQGGVLRGASGNFNKGESGIKTAFETVKSSTGQEILLPLRPGVNARISSGYGAAGSPRHGRERNHGGVDVAVAEGTPIISPVDGEVVLTGNHPDGYGIFVDVKDDVTGRVHRFAHLQKFNVEQGQRVSRGFEVAAVGNTGRSSGAHLHWEVRSKSAGRFEQTLDIEEHAAELLAQSQSVTKPRGNNLSWYDNLPNPYSTEEDQTSNFGQVAMPGRAVPLMGNVAVLDGLLYANGKPINPITENYNVANPIKNTFVSYDKKGFDPQKHNSPTNNYGYAQLAREPKRAAKVNEVATRLGIPAVWLADVIAFESGFRTDIDNGYDDDGDGHGYVGLIQFGAGAAKDLGTSPAELKRMDFNTQMEYVYKYLNQGQFRGKLKTVQHVLAAVFGGRGLIDKLDKNPQSAYRTGDINISFGDYIQRLGKDVGRKYAVPGLNARSSRVASVIHESYQPGCTVCNSLKASNSPIVPHEGQS